MQCDMRGRVSEPEGIEERHTVESRAAAKVSHGEREHVEVGLHPLPAECVLHSSLG